MPRKTLDPMTNDQPQLAKNRQAGATEKIKRAVPALTEAQQHFLRTLDNGNYTLTKSIEMYADYDPEAK